jgi:hypothetical protein
MTQYRSNLKGGAAPAAPLFDVAESERRKEEGMALARLDKGKTLQVAKELAYIICRCNGTVTTDDIAYRMNSMGLHYSVLGNAAGSIFKGKQWEWTGQCTRSDRVLRHRGVIRVWRLKDATGN